MELTELVAFLAPFVPYLVKGGEAVAETVGKKFGSVVWQRARAIWAAITPKSAAMPGLQDVVADLEKDPTNEPARGALVYYLGKLLKADPELKATVERIWQDADPMAVQSVVASGERAVAAGRDITGTIITGDVGADKGRPGRG